MKLLMIIVPTECREELEVLMHRNEIAAYAEIPEAHGVGKSGIRMGSRAHPKTLSIFFTVLEDDLVATLKKKICDYCDAVGDKPMRMIQWGVEEFV